MNVQTEPDLPVVALLERVQFAVIGASVRINFGLSIRSQNSFHRPFCVDKATVAYF